MLLLVSFGFLGSAFSQLPISSGAPYVGQKLPDFTLPDQNGKPVSLGDLLRAGQHGKSTGLVLIFYRGYW
jgi:cytochrome oxidase Cu insertion factor (SCO1/SenC/PrrC family)